MIFRRFFTQNMRQFLTVSVVVQILSVLVFVYSYAGLWELSKENIKRFADNFVEKAAEEMSRNNVYMVESTVNTSDYRNMFRAGDLERIDRISELQKTYKLLSDMSVNHYNFFAYDIPTSRFVELTAVKLQFSQYRQIKRGVLEHMEREPEAGRWYLLDTGKERILISVWVYGDFALGSWIDETSFLSYMSGLDCGPEGGAELFAKADEPEEAVRRGKGMSIISYDLSESNTDFGIRIVIQRSPDINRIMLMQIIQFILALQVMMILLMLVMQVRKNLIIPVRNLMEVLSRYRLETPEGENGAQSPEPVYDAYRILDKLGEMVENLQVELYKSELEKKQLQLNFRNVQIRPHFYINCLAMLSGMAQMNDGESIHRMTVCLSEYYRYVLHDCMDMVPLIEEVRHMENVIRVNSELSSNELRFSYTVQEEVRDDRIPILSVNTFLENSIKHSTGKDGIVEIELTAKQKLYEQETYLYLCIKDNGEGFLQETADRLNRGELLEEKDGRHIGINNVLQRLRLIYGGKAGCRFWGGQEDGACVELWIPENRENRENEETG